MQRVPCETFNNNWCDHVIFKADGGSAIEEGWSKEPRWKSPWFLKRADSRIDLEITAVRVQRLHSISPVDVEAEGVLVNCDGSHGARSYFVKEWDKINGKRAPWASNPWTWALTFRRVKP